MKHLVIFTSAILSIMRKITFPFFNRREVNENLQLNISLSQVKKTYEKTRRKSHVFFISCLSVINTIQIIPFLEIQYLILRLRI